MTEYTKGEWSVLIGKTGSLSIISTIPKSGYVDPICEVSVPSTGYRVEAEANAQLISSAPALYEALETSVKHLQASATITPQMNFQEVRRILPTLIQALAKVEDKRLMPRTGK